ncbi:ESX secretion-associated protein EspG [Nocardia sp. 004]|uniref:ESX secretion-associated protein EspG n=1 Tax=Nocardia sp. 004 TaxID=3385978 RepID=UPI00399FFFBE
MIHWRLTSQQFEAAFFAMRRDRLPYPIRNTVRAENEADLGQRRRTAIDTLLPRLDDDFARLMHTLADPQVRVHMHGRGGDDPADHGTRSRGYAGFGPSIAAVAIQDQDEEPGVSGEITVSLCSPHQAFVLLAGTLPEQRQGRHRLTGLKSELDIEPDWVGGWNRPPTLRERIEAFFSRSRTEWGEVLCYPGPFLDNRTDGVEGFFWMDFPGDGRYYVRADSTSYTVTPMGSDQFVEYLRALAWRVRELGTKPAAVRPGTAVTGIPS